MSFKMPSKNVVFWMLILGFIAGLVAIWASNNVDAIDDLVG